MDETSYWIYDSATREVASIDEENAVRMATWGVTDRAWADTFIIFQAVLTVEGVNV